MILPGFMPYSGSRLRLTRRPMVTSEAKSIGDALVQTSAAVTLSAAATNYTTVFGVYFDADRSSASTDVTTNYTVMLITPDIQWYANVEAGTWAASCVSTDVDLNSADGIHATNSTNDDFHVDAFINSTTGVGRFNNGIPRTL